MAPPLPITFGAASARGFGLFSAPAALASDPYFEYVTMLLHGDGTNGAQNNTFLDSSTVASTVTRNGNTMQGTFSPFSRADGNWSNYFNQTNIVTITNSTNNTISTGDFTVEGWINFSAVSSSYTSYSPSNQYIFDIGVNGTYFSWRSDVNSGRWIFQGTGITTALTYNQVPNVGQWYHFALTREGNTFRLFIDGTLRDTQTSTGTLSSGNWHIGDYGGTGQYGVQGYLSNFRVVKGAALYTASFTPATSPLTTTVSSGTVGILTCQSNRFKDNSVNNYSISLTGTPSIQVFNPFNPTAAYSTSTNGGSGFFDGSGDYLTVPDNAAFDMGTGDVTIEAWIYVTNIPSSTAQGIFGNLNTGYEFYMYPYGPANTIAIGVQTFEGGYAQTYITNNYVRINEWTHVAFTRASGTNRFFVNGVLCTTTGTLTNALNASGTQEIGRRAYAPTDYFYGYMSNLRIVKGTAVYTSAFTPPTAPLTAISGTSLLLSFTNAGVVDNAAMFDFETVGGAQVSTVQKKFGTGSLYFDGSGDYLQMPATQNVAFGTGDFTIEFWAYSGDVSGSTQRGHLQTSTTAGGFSTGYTTGITFFQGANSSLGILNGGLAVALGTGSSYVVVGGSAVLTANQWQHIALTRSGTNARLFVDGVQVGSTVTHSYSLDATNMVLGGYYQTSYFLYLGYLDEVRITKGYARYTANFTPPTAAFPDF